MRYKYTKELLTPLVKNSHSWAEVCRKLDIKPATGSQTHIANKAKKFNIDYSHFTGKVWSKGQKIGYKRQIDYYLILNEDNVSNINSDKLKKRLIEENIKENKCEICGLNSWLDKDLPLHLDHKNRNHYDNRLENLQIICPNCHSQKTREDRKKYARVA